MRSSPLFVSREINFTATGTTRYDPGCREPSEIQNWKSYFASDPNSMNTPLSSQPPSILDQLLTPVGDCLTPEVARHLVDLHASADVQARLEALADKSTEGQLSAEE